VTLNRCFRFRRQATSAIHLSAVDDGQRFVVIQPLAGTDPPITVVLNWQATLKK